MQSDGSQLAMTDGEWKDLLAAAVSQLKKVQDERNFYRYQQPASTKPSEQPHLGHENI